MTAVASGIERKIDRLGRVVIPSSIRERFGLSEGTYVELSVREGTIVLTPMHDSCPICGRPVGDAVLPNE
jgi:AbrB family looped-hinge helix DNA binding protein